MSPREYFLSRKKASRMVDPNVARWFEQVDKTRTGRLNAAELQEALKNNNYSSFDINVVAAMIGPWLRVNHRFI